METIKDYQIVQKIYESANSLVYRAIYKPNSQLIILKILKENYPTPSELNRYKQEYEITRSLNAEGVIKAYDLQRYENSLVIFLEDFGGESLKLLMCDCTFTLEEFLSIAIQTTESLAAIHAANIIHKDINPSNIVYNPATKQLKIIDFGISTSLARENQQVENLDRLEGTLAYIAPEQTGRMNRGLDYRGDFYSLGATFYELLTNQLPFATSDSIELVHCHLAQQPITPKEVSPAIPQAISDLVMKLLAKTPEERYQSAVGIKADLETCLTQLENSGRIERFSLATQDICDHFIIPEQLYGREKEIARLLSTFERVSQGNTEMMLVAGYSGIGKSALVNEIHKPILRQRGYFISGKFDQLKRDIPYAAIALAFQDLIRQLLTEPQAALQAWKRELLAALNPNAQVIIDVIPELEQIIGKQQPVEQLGATESQNRFNLFFQRFVNVFTTKEHPLVIFIDDLQWADLASLKLIELLIADSDSQYLLLIGAYRDNEINATHPLTQNLEQIAKEGARVNDILLQPLETKYINQLIADTLNCSTAKSKPLAELVNTKTQGNPFFLTQLLQYLYKENLLSFDHNENNWHWNIKEIKQVGITDNVVDLTIDKIGNLSDKTQKALQLAACIGNQFDLETLAIINNKSQITTARELQSALESGLILPLSNEYKIPLLWNQSEILKDTSEIPDNFIPEIPRYIPYKFLHDRVQQASSALIPEAEKKVVHLQVGRLLLKNIQQKKVEENIFEIANHLNVGIELITEQLEKDKLAKLNLLAGKKAKVSTAYQPALKYLEIALQLLPPNAWEQKHKLSWEINIEILYILYLNTRFIRVEELSIKVLEKVKDPLKRVQIYRINILNYFASFQQQKAIDTALKALEELQIKVFQFPGSGEIEKIVDQKEKEIQLFLSKKTIENLANFSQMTDRYKLEAISILQFILSSTIQLDFSLHIQIILIQIDLCIKYGNPPEAACIYSAYGMHLCGAIKNINSGYEFGELSLKLLENSNTSKFKALVTHIYYGFIWHWKKFIRNRVAQEKLLQGFQEGINAGDNEYASYTIINYLWINFFGGYYLKEIENNCEKYNCYFKKMRQEYSIYYMQIYQKIICNLLYNKDKYYYAIDNNREKQKLYLEKWIKNKNTWLLNLFYISQTIFSYFIKDYATAFKSVIKAKKYLENLSSYIILPQNILYFSLSFLAHYHSCNIEQQENILKQVEKNQQDMKIWAGHCPENFQNKYDLVAAEKARVLGQNWQAQEFYEKAIQGAKKSEFIHEEAIAYERAAEFYLSLDREEIGHLYLKNAHHCYSRWGAKAKVEAMEAEYPRLFARSQKVRAIALTESTANTNTEMLDLTSVIKASQTLASEIQLEQLLARLMQTVIENAGAQQGFLILEQDNRWVIQAEGNADRVDVLRSDAVLGANPSAQRYPLGLGLSIDSIDSDRQTPILPVAIVNYVIRTQEDVVLSNATEAEQFIRDPYIVATQPKSILCIPLLDRGKLSGILYLENNLTTDVFTSDRLEVLKILSSQAAISIENARLYKQLEDYNRNLELRVEDRTQELSHTLEVLQATQAELIFENELLRNNEPTSAFDYQVGGSLSMDAPTYVVRSADRYLYKALKRGEFCYILNPRQMGKSSLMVRMINHLSHEEYSCGAIDLTRIGSENVTPEQWYKGLAVELWRSFALLKKVNLKTWWQEQGDLAPVQRLSQFIEEVLLAEVVRQDDSNLPNIIIFIDEIDSLLGLNFPVNDFFALIRSCYNQRSINPEYQRLTFAFFGVATPNDLITNYQRTPFNIGHAIQLEGFKEHEAQPLLQGLTEKVDNPQTVLKEVLTWTNGQPFLTQKLCQLIRNAPSTIPVNRETEWIANLVQTKIIENWESQDEPEHLRTIRDRLFKSQQSVQLLELYRQILHYGELPSTDSPEEKELLLAGLVVKQEGTLKVQNRIYRSIFV